MKKHFVIIGNSAAGIGALEAIRKHDQLGTITVISEENRPVYSRCLLSYFLAGKLDESRLLLRPPDFHQQMKATVLLGRKVESVDPASQQVVCDDRTRVGYDQLLIATGGSPKIPAQIPKELEGVFVLRNMADALAIRHKMRAGTKAVVLGGGLVGMKAAFALNQGGAHVTVVVRSRFVLSQMIDAGAARIVMDQLHENGIEVLTGADISGVEDRDGKLVAVNISSEAPPGRSLPCDLLVVAKGVEPNKELVQGTEMEQGTGILTSARMQTCVANVYAAGDVAETLDIATGMRAVNALWTCAVRQGKVAGLNMAGQAREYDGSLGMNSINFPGVDLIAFGVVRPPHDAGYEVLVDQRPRLGVYKKLVLKEDRIKGLILVNRIDNAGVLLSLLGRKVNVADIRDDLLSDRFGYANVLGQGGGAEWSRYWNTSTAPREKIA